jgi:glucosamine-6-phosphate deaminase
MGRVDIRVCSDATTLAHAAATVIRDRLRANPDLAMAVPAGRTPRRMYTVLRELHAQRSVPFERMRVFSIDELLPPAPPDGYFWRQIRDEFLSWAPVDLARCHPFRVAAPDLDAMCKAYEETITRVGGLDLVMMGLGPNGHIASNEPGCDFTCRTRVAQLRPETTAYILTDEVIQGAVSDRAVTLGVATILEAREVVVLVSGAAKRAPLRRMLEGEETPELPASVLRRHPRCLVIADLAAYPGD